MTITFFLGKQSTLVTETPYLIFLIFLVHERSFYATISMLLAVDISDNNIFSSAPKIKQIYSFASVSLLTDLWQKGDMELRRIGLYGTGEYGFFC